MWNFEYENRNKYKGEVAGLHLATKLLKQMFRIVLEDIEKVESDYLEALIKTNFHGPIDRKQALQFAPYFLP